MYRNGQGSSPLSRGILLPKLVRQVSGRIIPALAGNTRPWRLARKLNRDHPRSRGEYTVYMYRSSPSRGSSPLSRGIPCHAAWPLLRLRIIPALAGNTRAAKRAPLPAKDHPRSRGEYLRITWKPAPRVGSSPLSRGILLTGGQQKSPEWIIPALAGNTVSRSFFTSHNRDHPRSRGEYPVLAELWEQFMGSSPLSRGILWPIQSLCCL